MSKEALQTAEERREVNGHGERERYTQQNAEVQKITRRGKKAFFNEECKEIEKNKRMGKARNFFKKIGDIKGTLNVRMGIIKSIKW